MNKTALGLGVVAAVVGVYALWPESTASAAELPPPPPKKPTAGSPPRAPVGAILRRGPNNTVLLTDLPAECQGYYEAAFTLTGPSGCAEAYEVSAELDRMAAQYMSNDPFYDQDRYDDLAAYYDRIYARCAASESTEEEAIATWVDCLKKNGLTPNQVWVG